jgi:hypothetical protein
MEEEAASTALPSNLFMTDEDAAKLNDIFGEGAKVVGH